MFACAGGRKVGVGKERSVIVSCGSTTAISLSRNENCFTLNVLKQWQNGSHLRNYRGVNSSAGATVFSLSTTQTGWDDALASGTAKTWTLESAIGRIVGWSVFLTEDRPAPQSSFFGIASPSCADVL